LEQQNDAIVPEAKSEKKERTALSIFRTKAMRALFLGASLTLLEACGLTREEKDKLPTTTVEQISEHSEELLEVPLTKTLAYIQDLGETKSRHTVLAYYGDSFHTDTVEETVHEFIIRDQLDKNSPSFSMIETSEIQFGPWSEVASLVIDEAVKRSKAAAQPKYSPEHRFEIIGKVARMKEAKDSRIVFKLGQVEDLSSHPAEAPESVASNKK
jgi:hypothetical protein